MKVVTIMVGMSFVLVAWRKWRGFTPVPTAPSVTTSPAAVPVNMNEDSFFAEMHAEDLASLNRTLHIEAEMDRFA